MVNEISPLNCVDFFVLFKKGPLQFGLKKNKHTTLYLKTVFRYYILLAV